MEICVIRKCVLVLLFSLFTAFHSFAQVNIGASSYLTLADAFDDINNGNQTGNVVITISGNISSNVTAILSASGIGQANYNSVLIYPTAPNCEIYNGGSNAITLDGASNVTIDGRVNLQGSTKDLTIINSVSDTTSNICTIKFENGARQNTIRYCNIKGCEKSGNSGIVSFSTSTGNSGNSQNVIEYCDFTKYGNNFPISCIYSEGSPSLRNDSNIIRNNNFFDFVTFKDDGAAISIFSNNSYWTISNNSFFNRLPLNGSQYRCNYSAVNIFTNNGGFVVDGNYIGGSEEHCGGIPFYNVNSKSVFRLIQFFSTDDSTENIISNNTISNFNIDTCVFGEYFSGIKSEGGKVIIHDNTIGSQLTNGDITIYSPDYQFVFNGIEVTGFGSSEIYNNSIGSITIFSTGTNAVSVGFTGIYCNGGFINDIHDNIIGSRVVANSIQLRGKVSPVPHQLFAGIYLGYFSFTHENTISNIFNSSTQSLSGDATCGIKIHSTAINRVVGNLIENMTSNAVYSGTECSAPLSGISVTNDNSIQNTISHNEIRKLNMNASGAGNLAGIYSQSLFHSSSVDTIEGNFIHDLQYQNTGPLGVADGIRINFHTNDSILVFNNVIDLGYNVPGNLSMHGISTCGGFITVDPARTNIYFNTISIYIRQNFNTAFYSAAISKMDKGEVANIRNNIFSIKSPSGANGSLSYIADISSMTNLNIDNNNYHFSGFHLRLGKLGNNIAIDLTDWKILTGQDSSSLNLNPAFGNIIGDSATDFIAATILPGASGLGIDYDYLNASRDSLPQMGAFETFCVMQPSQVDIGICDGDTFPFNGSQLSTSGVYNALLTNVNGCDSTVELHLTVNPLPVPVVTAIGDHLSVQPFVSYQWHLSGSVINNANQQNYIAPVNGWYSVLVTDSNGCSAESNLINVSTALVKANEQIKLSISPSPALNTIKIIYPQEMIAALVDVIDVSGQVVIKGKSINDQLDISGLAGGTYFVAVHNKEQSYKVQFVKQ